MSALALQIIYHAFFTQLWVTELYSGKNLSQCSTIFSMQKKAIRIIKGCGNRVSCGHLFKKWKTLTLTSQCLLSLLMLVIQNKNLFLTNNENHNIDTRQRNNLYLPQANLTIYQRRAYYLGIKIFNNLPREITNVADNLKEFKTDLKQFLYTYSFYNFIHWKNILISHGLCIVFQNFWLYCP